MSRPSPLLLLPAALLFVQGCTSTEEYRARTSSDTARAANAPPAARAAEPASAPAAETAPASAAEATSATSAESPAPIATAAPLPPARSLTTQHRTKPYAYSVEAGGLTLGADATQAHLQLEGKDGYLPLGVVIANRSRADLLLTLNNFRYRKGEDGEWQPLPSYEEVHRTTFPSSSVRRQISENDAFSTRVAYSAMRRVTFSPYPGAGNVRVDDASLNSQSYAWVILYIPNPGMAGSGGNHYLRYTDSERHAEITLLFPLVESKH